MRKLVLLLITCCTSMMIFAQDNLPSTQRLKVYIDCSNTWCDMSFIRTEINIVDFYLDRLAADLHVLITEQRTGSGGRQYQIIFFGQNRFENNVDTFRFSTEPNLTDFESRDIFIKYLKLGLSPFIAKTGQVKNISIDFKKSDGKINEPEDKIVKDPWNYWVFRAGVNGNVNAEERSKNFRLGANLSATRVTEDLKVIFETYGNKNTSSYKFEDTTGAEVKTIKKRDDYSFQHYLIKSLSDHWSYAYGIGLSRNTYSNNKSRVLFETGIEYAIFPYKQVNTKFFTVSYKLDVRRNLYFDTTLFNKTKETLFGQGVESNLSFKQKWGTISFGLEYRNYLHNWKYFNLGFNTEIDIRITGGLSFRIYSFAELTHDQLYLPPDEGATLEQILIGRTQLASGYYFYTNFGLTYRFGSKLNNFVNPRFD